MASQEDAQDPRPNGKPQNETEDAEVARKERQRAYVKAWRLANRQKTREHSKRWKLANPERAKASSQASAFAWRKRNIERQRVLCRRWRKENKDRQRELTKQWIATHSDRHRALKLAWHKRQMRESPRYRIRQALGKMVIDCLGRKRNRSRTIDLLGCSIEQFIAHLESLFQPGMNWQNHGRDPGQWSIDHVRPCASFDLTDKTQVAECFHYSNLRPLWHSENCSKQSLFNGKRWTYKDHPACTAVQPA